MRLPNGYETVLHERGSNLSVGQRQLIAFARALVADPRILILDEATANVDSYTERLIQDALKELLRGRTAIIIAHRLSTIQDADKILVMQQGRIAELGKHNDLLALNGLYAKLYAMNFPGPAGLKRGPAGAVAADRHGYDRGPQRYSVANQGFAVALPS